MTDEDFIRIMELRRELSGVEFKSPGPMSNRRLVAQVIKAILGMSNRRDGGIVIIGVEDSSGVLTPVGLMSSALDSWTPDALSDQVSNYADPSASFTLEKREYEGNVYVAIEVEEFSDIPVLCKRDYGDVLRAGAFATDGIFSQYMFMDVRKRMRLTDWGRLYGLNRISTWRMYNEGRLPPDLEVEQAASDGRLFTGVLL